ncbi:[protein-PII] uridylyltransferase [Corynebacterium diphtheriae]|uniref:[protein-PII] uridylyltransferase n=1 Tax=Corynebacterium diphtheriae TaxID=1717 RepID=UPI000260193C|nr:[protein-PII] uridylyltransferase [Corynebacterium diphtheriae]EIK55934.1 PII uridylyl-transferase [Corynebacterium diphtheriae bv. intermedius str. NCTC 5011]
MIPFSAAPADIRERACEQALAVISQLQIPPSCAIAATGSLARREMTSYSDIDLILLHPEGSIPSGLEHFWYPIWDAKIRLDYTVRTPKECADMISAEPTAALALLDISHCSGDPQLTATTRLVVLEQWRRELKKNFNDVTDTAIARWNRSGSVVDMTHPDLKHGRGGLRDIELIRALALGNLCDKRPLGEERQLLLNIRTMLHQHAGRARDVLDPEFAVDVALDLGCEDRYDLSRSLAKAARTIDDATNTALSTARNLLPRRSSVRKAVRRPVDIDVVEVDGTLALSRTPNLEDPSLVLRVAAASARTGMTISESTWKQLETVPSMPPTWPSAAASNFFALLSSSVHSQRVIRELDEHGFWSAMIPQWEHIRGRMPRESVHIHTIDVHSMVVTANCATQSIRVARPDLLFLAALFHDIGKGDGRRHEEVGAQFVVDMATTLRLNPSDTQIVETLVAQHTIIPHIVGRYNPTSTEAIDKLLDAVNYDLLTLDLLEALVEADAQGTAPGVWSAVLRYGTRELCAQARQRLTAIVPNPPSLSAVSPLSLTVVKDTLPTGKNYAAEVEWSGDYVREIVRVLALIAAKEWNIESAEIVVVSSDDEPASENGSVGVSARMRVYNRLGTRFDSAEFEQAYKSGVHSSLPPLDRGKCASFWVGNILEVRTTDRRAALGHLLGVLPDLKWARMSNPGATMIVQCELKDGFDRSKVERDVTRVLTNG